MKLFVTSICVRNIPSMFSFSLNNNTSIDRDRVYLTLLVSDFTAGLTIHPLNVEPGQYRHSLNFTGCQIRSWNSSPSASAYSVDNTTFSFLTYAAEVLHNRTSSQPNLCLGFYKDILVLNVLLSSVLHSCLVLLASCHLHVTPPSRSTASTLLFC